MPTWPTPEGRRVVTLEMPLHLIEHLDSQAKRRGCSRAAFVRWLIVNDIEHHTATAAQA